MPLVARDLLHGSAQTYGTMLSAFGLGAVIAALNITEVRKGMSGEAASRACALSMGGDCRGSAKRGAVTDSDCAIPRGRGVDDGMGRISHRGTAVGAALGRRSFACGLPGGGIRRGCSRLLGLGLSG